MEIISHHIIFLIPGKIETLMLYANYNSNFGTYGMYMGIRNRRNMIYFSQATSLVFYIFNYKKTMILCLLLLLMQFNSYIRYINKYKLFFY